MPSSSCPVGRRRRFATLAALSLLIGAGGDVAPAAAADTLADAYATIAGKTFVDLTHSFGTDRPVWSGFGQATMTAAADPATHQSYTIETNGFRTTF